MYQAIGNRSPILPETEAQASALCDLGCVLAQGYLLGRPADERRDQPIDRDS